MNKVSVQCSTGDPERSSWVSCSPSLKLLASHSVTMPCCHPIYAVATVIRLSRLTHHSGRLSSKLHHNVLKGGALSGWKPGCCPIKLELEYSKYTSNKMFPVMFSVISVRPCQTDERHARDWVGVYMGGKTIP